MTGPLAGVRVVEFGSIGPGPFAAMVLGDLGAHVTRVERVGTVGGHSDAMHRNRAASIGLDLKRPEAVEVALRLVAASDVSIEGLRPGVMERLGLGPDACLERNPRLVYGRVTGWGQEGPRASEAGHDIDYIAVAGALHPIGDATLPPPPPLNMVADFGGGGMLLVAGILAALVERSTSGRGDVIDAAMVDGVALLTTMFHAMRADGLWTTERESNWFDGGAPFYRTYRTADDRFVAVGAIEPAFYAALLHGLGLAEEALPAQLDRPGWPHIHDRFAEVFRTRTRAEWSAVFDGTDACVAPVLDLAEAPGEAHMKARTSFVEVADVVQPAPAPRFSRSATGLPAPPRSPGADSRSVLADLGYGTGEIEALLSGGVVA